MNRRNLGVGFPAVVTVIALGVADTTQGRENARLAGLAAAAIVATDLLVRRPVPGPI